MHLHDITHTVPHALPAPPPTGAAPPRMAAPASLEGLLAAAWKDVGLTAEPPVGWLTRTVAAITAHLQDRPEPAYDTDSVLDPGTCRCADSQRLADLRRRVRQQLAGAVAEGHLDGDLANGMLDHFDLLRLRRYYQVRLGVAVDVEVCATDEDDAYDQAEDAVEQAPRNAAYIELDPSGGERIEATSGDFNDDGTDNP